MDLNYVDLEPDNVPYEFDLDLSSRTYTFTLNYNELFDYFTMDVALGNTILLTGEKLVLGQFLFQEYKEDANGNVNPNWFSELLYLGCDDASVTRVSLDNLNETVFLYVTTKGELGL